MLWEALLLGLLVGWYRKGTLESLLYIKIRYVWLVFASVLLKFGLNYAAANRIEAVSTWAVPVHYFSYLLLFIFIAFNWRLPGMKLFALGSLLNLAVISVNHGTMPVEVARLGNDLASILQNKSDATHSIMGPDTRLRWLGDIIYLPYPRPRRISPGDIALSFGLFVFLVKAMTTRFMYRVDMTKNFAPVISGNPDFGKRTIRSLKRY